MRILAWLVVASVLGSGLAHADQTVLGKEILLQDPAPGIDQTKRKLVVQAKEVASPDAVLGDPTESGATLTVFVTGTSLSQQVPFTLPVGTDPASGKPFWSAIKGGFKYKDAKGANGAVKLAEIKRSNSGTVSIKVVATGKNGPIAVVPPNPGSSACARLEVAPGNSYHVLLPSPPDATIKKNDAKTFEVKDAVVEGFCSTPPVCGNGIREPGEACDGGPFCSDCFANIPSCCVVPDQCETTPSFSLLTMLIGYCSNVFPPIGTSQVIGGGVCQADGSCTTEAFSPMSVCCKRSGSCTDEVVSDTGALWSFHNLCQGGGPGLTMPDAHCVAESCVSS